MVTPRWGDAQPRALPAPQRARPALHSGAMRMTRILPVLVLVALAGVAPALAQRPDRPRLAGEDWVQLFNGTDLTGWVNVGQEKWTVTNGELHGEAVTKGYGYLKTEKNYKDFVLALRFKC